MQFFYIIYLVAVRLYPRKSWSLDTPGLRCPAVPLWPIQ